MPPTFRFWVTSGSRRNRCISSADTGSRDVTARGRTPSEAMRSRSGCFAVVLEGVPLELGREITAALKIPTIGIGAGMHCDGQVLVLHDLIGLSFGKAARFVRRYAEAGDTIRNAISAFREDVRAGRYPSEEESYAAAPERPETKPCGS